MNDLAEKALQGLDAARRQVTGRPVAALAVAGFVVSSAVVFAGGVVSAVRPTRSPTSWFGLEDAHGADAARLLPGIALLATLAVLVALWVFTLEVVRRVRLSQRRVWVLVAAWTTPFALGPPLMDTSVYSSAAYGFVQRARHDPYTFAPSGLDNRAVVDAMLPGTRDTVSAAGPLGSLLQHLAVSTGGGTALGAVIVLRVIGVLAAIAIGRLAVELAGRRRSEALALCALNPLVLLYVVSSPHLDGPMVALVLAALVAAHRRRWLVAVALACAAGSVSAQAFVVVPVVVVVHALGRRSRPVWLVVGRDLAVGALVTVGFALLAPGRFGWIGTVSDQFSAHTPFAIGNAVGRLLSPVVPGASYDDLATSGRITAATAAVCVVAYLVVSAGYRSLDRSAGFALLAAALLAPNLYPWYLLWGLLCLAPTVTGDRRILVVAGSAGACVLVPVGFGPQTANLVTAVGLVVVAAVALARRSRHPAQPPDRPAQPPDRPAQAVAQTAHAGRRRRGISADGR